MHAYLYFKSCILLPDVAFTAELIKIYMFYVRALRNIYTYVANQQLHTDETW
jgi:hypothetical protein